MRIDLEKIIKNTQVNIPFTMLVESHVDRFLEYGLNPEIGIDAEALTQYSISDFQRYAKQFHDRGRTITLHAPFMDLSPGSRDPEIRNVARKRFEQVLQLVPIFKPLTVVCHAGYEKKRYEYSREFWIEKSLEIWSWFGSALKDEGTALMLENVYEDGPEDIKILFEHLEVFNVGFCLDAGHQSAYGCEPLNKWIDTLGEFLGQVHLHDNFGHQDEHLSLGTGHINFQPLWHYLTSRKNNPPVITLEPHEEKDLWPSIDYLKKIKIF